MGLLVAGGGAALLLALVGLALARQTLFGGLSGSGLPSGDLGERHPKNSVSGLRERGEVNKKGGHHQFERALKKNKNMQANTNLSGFFLPFVFGVAVFTNTVRCALPPTPPHSTLSSEIEPVVVHLYAP